MLKAFRLLLSLLLLPLLSLSSDEMLGRKMPLPPEPTLSGRTIDAAYFKGHITLVTFMYIGCPPCMNEIGALNRLRMELAGDKWFQILCIARQMRSQMLDFVAKKKNFFSDFRKDIDVDSVQYDIVPACPEGESKIERTVNVRNKGRDTAINIRLNSECDVVEQLFGIDSYPTIFFVDGEGIIRKISYGGPMANHDDGFYRQLKQDVEAALSY